MGYPPRYAVIDLGTNFIPAGINNSNVIAGNTVNLAAELWSNGAPIMLPNGPNGPGQTYAINDQGTVSGSAAFFYAAPSPNAAGYPAMLEMHACSWAGVSNPVDLDQQYNSDNLHNARFSLEITDRGGASTNVLNADYQSQGACIMADGTVYGLSSAHSDPIAAYFSPTGPPTAASPTNSLVSGYSAGEGPHTEAVSAAGTNWCGVLDPGEYGYMINTNVVLYPDGSESAVTVSGINTNAVAVGYQVAYPVLQPVTVQGTAITTLPWAGLTANSVDQGLPIALNDFIANLPPPYSNQDPQIVGSSDAGAILWDYTDYNGTNTTSYVPKVLTP